MKLNDELKTFELTVEAMSNPIGIDILEPQLSWKMASCQRGILQSAYRILVASCVEDLETETNLLWDTKKVASSQSVHVTYNGAGLLSRKPYYWKVKIWDHLNQESAWSECSSWEMGLLQEGDWLAQWIEPVQEPVVLEDPINLFEMFSGKFNHDPEVVDRLHPCQLLRKSFDIGSEVQRARIYATAHGVYSLELNGQKVGNCELAPEYTAYDEYLQYQTYDVSTLLSTGVNAIGVVIADGWYAGRVSLTGDSGQFGVRLGLLFQLEIEYTNGTRDVVYSNETFRSSIGPWIYSDLFIGEKYDARLEKKGFSTANYDDTDWQPVHRAEHDFHNLVASYGDPVRAVMQIAAQSVIETPRGEIVVDFGQVIAGRVRMCVKGEVGTEVVLEHSETLDQDGNYLMNIMGRHKDQKDVYILRGGDEEQFEPKFTYHGFRYVKVTGYPETVSVDSFVAIVISSNLKQTGSFVCSDSRINRLQENIVWSQRGNMLSIPTDCPQRERLGYTGDIQVFAPTASLNMDVKAFLTRWLRNLAIEQRKDGQVPNTVPWNRSDRERDEKSGNSSSAGWGDAAVIVPWTLYQFYGDKRVLEESYSSMAKWVAYITETAASHTPDEFQGIDDASGRYRQPYLWNTGFHFGDWLTPSLSMNLDEQSVNMMNSAFLTKELVATCFFASSTDIMARAATVLGYEDEAKRYKELNQKVRSAFSGEYLRVDGRLKVHLQGIYVLALQHQMVPEARRSDVLAQLIGLIEENNYRLDTGFMSIPFLLDVLSSSGHEDIAYKLLYQTDCPSWLYEVDKGATTIWEAWNTIMPNGAILPVSQNHYAFGCVGSWLFTHLAGLNRLEPGYKCSRIRPNPDCGLEWVKATYDSVYGMIYLEWVINDGQITLNITIPANTTTEIYLPRAKDQDIKESGISLMDVKDIHIISEEEDYVCVQAGSGSYSFQYLYPH